MLRRFTVAFLISSAVAVPYLIAPAPAAAAPDAKKAPAPAPAPAKDGPGTTAVKQANTAIANLLKQKAAPGSKEEKELAGKVTTSVRNFIDIDQLGKRAMVDQWPKLSKEQQEQFLSLLRQLIEENYIRGLRSNLEYSVAYTGETADKDGNIVVATKISAQRKGRPFTIGVDYVLVKDGDKLRAFDIKTDGVGLVENYRTSFNKIVEKEGFDGLIGKMKKKLAEVQAAPATPKN
jgi:phospholipid transport system substrate-binding protein